MKAINDGDDHDVSALTCAHHLMTVTPHVMQALREEVRRQRPLEFSVPEFRALGYIERHEGTALTSIAEHIGLSVPSLSKIVARLEAHKLIKRRVSAEDKRRLTLSLTAHGERVLQGAHDAAMRSLAGRIADLAPREVVTVQRAMTLLAPLFGEASALNPSAFNQEVLNQEVLNQEA